MRQLRREAGDIGRVWRVGLRLALLALCVYTAHGHAQDACLPILGRVVSIQGQLEIKRAGKGEWTPLKRLNTAVCAGDILHTGRGSRAGVLLAPETMVRLDQHSTFLIRKAGAETEFELYLEERVPRDVVGNVCGAAHVITRVPRNLRVKTPYVNASVEGTEFQVALACDRATLSVFEGRMSAQSLLSQSSSQRLEAGQVTAAGANEALSPVKVLVNPRDAVQWALFYPALGDSTQEVDSDCAALPPEKRATCLIARAQRALRAGRVDEAQSALRASSDSTALSADAQALLSLVAVVKNDKADALRLANQAVELSDQSSRAWMALSYAQQAHFRLDEALAAARKAAALAPENVVTQIRVTELLMTLGQILAATQAAQTIVAAHPQESRAHAVLGYGYLAQLNISQARDAFDRAIELDSTDPLPRLGMGLALIRQGDLTGGREQIEIAVALDPANSLLRSYAGKAYYEENTPERNRLALAQFDLAKALDPKDPTPHFYDAILKQTQHQSAQALGELQSSMEKNNNRAVYRSKLLLDEDQAARGVSLAQVYRDLGFQQLAVAEAYNSIALEPGNAGAHRFLSDAFATLPNHQLAQSSELLQAQLRQPLTLDPIPAHRSAVDLSIPRSSGPATASQYELNPLFVSQGAAFSLDRLVGESRTNGGQASVSLLGEKHAMTAGIFRYKSDGFRQNNDIDRTIGSVLLQAMPIPSLSLQAELRNSDFSHGDLPLRFDPTNFLPLRRNDETRSSLRFGARIAPSPNVDFLVSGVSASETVRTAFLEVGDIVLTEQTEDASIEVQSMIHSDVWHVTVGTGHLNGNLVVTFEDSSGPFVLSDDSHEQRNHYVYASYTPDKLVRAVQVGLSVDKFDEFVIHRSEVNPKVGIILQPWSKATLRAAYIRAMRRILAANQSIEPTQVAGFNQIFNDPPGTVARRWGLGLDQKLGVTLFAGAEVSARNLMVPIIDTNTSTSYEVARKERLLRAYLNWIPHARVALSGEVFYQRYKRQIEDAAEEYFVDARTLQIPLAATVFLGERVSARGIWTLWRQSGTFVDPTNMPFAGKERFSVLDLLLSFRLPRRIGTLQVGINNVFDSESRYQETDQFSPRYVPKRVGYIRAQLSF